MYHTWKSMLSCLLFSDKMFHRASRKIAASEWVSSSCLTTVEFHRQEARCRMHALNQHTHTCLLLGAKIPLQRQIMNESNSIPYIRDVRIRSFWYNGRCFVSSCKDSFIRSPLSLSGDNKFARPYLTWPPPHRPASINGNTHQRRSIGPLLECSGKINFLQS